MSRIVLYRRATCRLCDEARQVIDALAHPGDEVLEVDIDTDPALVDGYTIRVPVVEVDGHEVAEYVVDETSLRTALGR